MVKLEARREGGNIVISSDSFRYLFDSLDKRVFLQPEDNEAIDDFCRQCQDVWMDEENAELPDEASEPTRNVFVRISYSVLGMWPGLKLVALHEDILMEGNKFKIPDGFFEVEKGMFSGDRLKDIVTHDGNAIILGDPDGKEVELVLKEINKE